MQIEHEVQLGILRQLLFKPESRFAELNTNKLDNNHFNFHLKRLVELVLVSKTDIGYKLTSEGLNIANKLDIRNTEIVKQ
ncbi:MAG: hypothetical protein Q8L51_03105, partial [Candidatus Amesbacteria bacterium]|nr:hypothetical protein [Candidatus Amesbacteria bacterium]